MQLHYLAKLLLAQSIQNKGTIVIKLILLLGVSGLADIISSSSAYSHQSLATGQFEARRYTNIVNSAQIQYYQKNYRFANSLSQLNIGIPERTDFYTYSVTPTKGVMENPKGATAFSADPLPNRRYLKKIDSETVALPTNKGNFTFVTKKCEATLSLTQAGSTNNYFGVMLSSYADGRTASLSCIEGFQELKGSLQ